MGQSSFIDPEEGKGGEQNTRKSQISPNLTTAMYVRLLFPSSSPSNHKQPKAGNRRAGKERDTVSLEKRTNDGVLIAGTWKTSLTVLHQTCAGFWMCSYEQSESVQSDVSVQAQLTASKHFGPQITTVFTPLPEGFTKSTQELCALNRPGHFSHGYHLSGSIISLSLISQHFLFLPFLFP